MWLFVHIKWNEKHLVLQNSTADNVPKTGAVWVWVPPSCQIWEWGDEVTLTVPPVPLGARVRYNCPRSRTWLECKLGCPPLCTSQGDVSSIHVARGCPHHFSSVDPCITWLPASSFFSTFLEFCADANGWIPYLLVPLWLLAIILRFIYVVVPINISFLYIVDMFFLGKFFASGELHGLF